MKKLFSLVFLLPAIVALGQNSMAKTITINGTATGDTKGYDYIYYYSSGQSDSVAIVNGKFKIELPFTEIFTQLFYTQYEAKTRHMYSPFPILIDGTGDIGLDMNVQEGFAKCIITGPQTTVRFNNFLKQRADAYTKINEGLAKLYGPTPLKPVDPLYQKKNVSRDSLSKLYMAAMVIDFVKQNKDAFVGVYVLSGQGRASLEIEQLETALKSLPVKMQKTPDGERLAAYIRGVKNTTIGANVKNFVLNGPDGKAFSFAALKGKYVWVDFWASWCSPCKQAFPHMRELYSKYKGKNFEILGISADAKIDPWLKILPSINNPWPQVWDDKNIVSEFAVTAFPTCFLIDPDGKIIAKEIGYSDKEKGEIEKKLEEIFGIAKSN